MTETQMENLIRRVLREELAATPGTSGDLITVTQAAALVSYGVTSIRRWLRDGTLKRYGEGRNVRVSRRQLLEVMARETGEATSDVEIERLADKALGRAS
ncbi:helix-turn-helix domain-containing protein [Corallococcus exiguus]|uniref:Helix-turn-helix domain-containing protein n=2 Tax=Corallococcus exiguus TaxID=83462 RepID=A0A7X4YA41_9BACT|nr:helix-turn-helix domain-containing protein [Corallococcus exiguus]NBC40482.1 helix-turn-helix domain-containing protein [Corallococcus exiguus]TNV64035.1 helix-turn-helix domain-containing protein [Corallococcus exiguus]